MEFPTFLPSLRILAPSTPEIPETEKLVPYEKKIIGLKKRLNLKKEIKKSTDMLEYALCRYPDFDDDDAVDILTRKTKKLQPESFPYAFYLMDEKAYERDIFSSYKGAVFWTDLSRDYIIAENQPEEYFEWENRHKLVTTSLKPIKIHPGGEKSMTVKEMCEAVAEAVVKLGYSPGNHHFLESIMMQMREIDGEEAVTIVFYAGPEQ